MSYAPHFQLAEQTTEFSNLINEVVGKLESLHAEDGTTVDFTESISNTSGNLSIIVARLRIIEELLSGIASAEEEKIILVPKNYFVDINQKFNKLSSTLHQILSTISAVEDDGGLSKIVPGSFQLESVNGAQNPDLTSHLKNTDNLIDGILDSVHRTYNIISPSFDSPFSGAISYIQKLHETIDEIRSEFSSMRQVVRQHKSRVNTFANDAESRADAIKQHFENSEEWKNQIESNKNLIDQLLSNINETRNNAQDLEEQISSYSDKIKKFDEKLDERNVLFEEGDENVKKLEKSLYDNDEQIKKILQESKEALGWANASGLAKSFEAASQEMDRPVLWAQGVFYTSVFLLMLSVALALNAVPYISENVNVPKILPPANANGVGAALYIFTSISLRVLILLPSLFLISFSLKKYRDLSKAKEQYRFKKTVASAIPGFKEQAPEHEQAMAAAAFERLLFNPQEEVTRDLVGDRKVGPLSRWLVGVVRAALYDAKTNVNRE